MSKLKELEKRLKDEPDSLGLRVMFASALLEAGRREDAIELYRTVAIAYREQGGIQQAITACQSILAIAPDDERSRQLLHQLVDVVRAPHETQPPRLPRPPRPGPSGSHDAQRDPDGEDAGDSARFSLLDMTPLPAPMPYHIAYPTASMPVVSLGDISASVQEDLSRHPQIAGIASAAREISASLIAASRDEEESEDDLAGELETRRLPRITPNDLRLISGPPPSFATDQIPVPEISEDLAGADEEPTLLPGSDSALDVGTVDDETTRPRDMALRKRPPSIAPPTSATGPLAGAFFLPVPPRDRAAVLQRFRRRMAATGTAIIRRGDTGHGLVVVVRGRLEVQVDRVNGARIVLAAIGPGEYVGETSLLTRSPATADIVAAVDSEIMVLAESEFYEVTGAFPALWIELKAVAERRSREHEHRLR